MNVSFSVRLVFLLLCLFLTYLLSIVFISGTPPNIPKADAIFVMAGADGERLDRGIELINSGYSRIIVVNKGVNWNTKAGRIVQEFCDSGDQNKTITVICIVASPDSTKGEAMTVSALANSNKWKSLLIVTSEYHVFRSATWFNRCFQRTFTPIPTQYNFSIKQLLREAAAVAHSFIIDRTCYES